MAAKPLRKHGVSIRQLVEEVPEGCSLPDFEQKPVTMALAEGRNAILRAVVCGEPRPEVHWQSSKGDLSNSSKYQIFSAPGCKEHALQINKLTGEDTDQYRCTAVNPYGEAVCLARVTVIVVGFRKKRKRNEEPQEDLNLTDLRKMLKKRGPPSSPTKKMDPAQVWQLLMTADRKDYERLCIKYGIVDFRGMLRKLEKMRKEREDRMAQYIHSVSNTRHIKVSKDGVASFELDLDLKDPDSNIYLCKDGETVPYSSDSHAKHSMRKLGRHYRFQIQDLWPEDAGIYQVKVEDAEVFSTELEASAIPPRVVEPLAESRCDEGSDVVFECILSNSCPDATWKFKNQPLQPGDKYDMFVSPDGQTHQLEVRGAGLSDIGPYSLDTGLHASSAWLVVEAEKDKGFSNTSADQQPQLRGAPTSDVEDSRSSGSSGWGARGQGPAQGAVQGAGLASGPQLRAGPDRDGLGGHGSSLMGDEGPAEAAWVPGQAGQGFLEADVGRDSLPGENQLHREGGWDASLSGRPPPQGEGTGSGVGLKDGRQTDRARDSGGDSSGGPAGDWKAGSLFPVVGGPGGIGEFREDRRSQLDRDSQGQLWGAQLGPGGGGAGPAGAGGGSAAGAPGSLGSPEGRGASSWPGRGPETWGSQGRGNDFGGPGQSLGQMPAGQDLQDPLISGGRNLLGRGGPEDSRQKAGDWGPGEAADAGRGYKTGAGGLGGPGGWGRGGQGTAGTLGRAGDGSSLQYAQGGVAGQKGAGGPGRMEAEGTGSWDDAGSSLSQAGAHPGPGWGRGDVGDTQVPGLLGSGQDGDASGHRLIGSPGQGAQGLWGAPGGTDGTGGPAAKGSEADFWDGRGRGPRGGRGHEAGLAGSQYGSGPGAREGADSAEGGGYRDGPWVPGAARPGNQAGCGPAQTGSGAPAGLEGGSGGPGGGLAGGAGMHPETWDPSGGPGNAGPGGRHRFDGGLGGPGTVGYGGGSGLGASATVEGTVGAGPRGLGRMQPWGSAGGGGGARAPGAVGASGEGGCAGVSGSSGALEPDSQRAGGKLGAGDGPRGPGAGAGDGDESRHPRAPAPGTGAGSQSQGSYGSGSVLGYGDGSGIPGPPQIGGGMAPGGGSGGLGGMGPGNEAGHRDGTGGAGEAGSGAQAGPRDGLGGLGGVGSGSKAGHRGDSEGSGQMGPEGEKGPRGGSERGGVTSSLATVGHEGGPRGQEAEGHRSASDGSYGSTSSMGGPKTDGQAGLMGVSGPGLGGSGPDTGGSGPGMGGAGLGMGVSGSGLGGSGPGTGVSGPGTGGSGPGLGGSGPGLGVSGPGTGGAGPGLGGSGPGMGVSGPGTGGSGPGLGGSGPGMGVSGPGLGVSGPGMGVSGPGTGGSGPGMGGSGPGMGVSGPGLEVSGPGLEVSGPGTGGSGPGMGVSGPGTGGAGPGLGGSGPGMGVSGPGTGGSGPGLGGSGPGMGVSGPGTGGAGPGMGGAGPGMGVSGPGTGGAGPGMGGAGPGTGCGILAAEGAAAGQGSRISPGDSAASGTPGSLGDLRGLSGKGGSADQAGGVGAFSCHDGQSAREADARAGAAAVGSRREGDSWEAGAGTADGGGAAGQGGRGPRGAEDSLLGGGGPGQALDRGQTPRQRGKSTAGSRVGDAALSGTQEKPEGSRGRAGATGQGEAGQGQSPGLLESKGSGSARDRSVGPRDLDEAWNGPESSLGSKDSGDRSRRIGGPGSRLGRGQRGEGESLGNQEFLEAENDKPQGSGAMVDEGQGTAGSGGSDGRTGPGGSRSQRQSGAKVRGTERKPPDETRGRGQRPGLEDTDSGSSGETPLEDGSREPRSRPGSKRGGTEGRLDVDGQEKNTSRSPRSRRKPDIDGSFEEARVPQGHFSQGLTDTEALLGEAALLSCTLSRDLGPGTWFKDGVQLSAQDGLVIEQDGLVHRLLIAHVQGPQAGRYSFVAGAQKTEATLTVRDPPVIAADVTEGLREPLVVKAGKPLALKIPFESRHPVQASWTKDGAEVEGAGGRGAQVSLCHGFTRLCLPSASRKDSGHYSLTLRSQGGSAQAEVTLHVIDKPQPPQGPLEAQDCRGSGICLRWRPPRDDGGRAVEHYVVERQQAGRSTWLKVGEPPADSTSFTDAQVERGKKYTFRVRAVTSEGPGEALESEEVLVAPEALPGPPSAPAIVSASSGSITMTWTAPRGPGSAHILGYLIDKRKMGSNTWMAVTDQPVAERRWTVTELRPDWQYEFRVTAVSPSGPGEPGPPSDAVFARDPMRPPGPVRDLQVTDTSHTSITLRWAQPDAQDGDEVQGYVVELCVSDSLEWAPCHAGTVLVTTYTAKGLRPQEGYFVRVVAVNDGGRSRPTALDMLVHAMPASVPPKFLVDSGTKDSLMVRAGDMIRVPVRFEAAPLPEVTWLKDGLPLPRRTVTTTQDGLTQLLVPTASLSDSGVYTVVLRGLQGKEATYTFRLSVSAKPQAPGPISLQENVPGTVTAEWEPSPDEARGVPLHYTVLTRSSGHGPWLEAADCVYTNRFTLLGVLPGHEYFFRVVAKNELGASEPSDTYQPWSIPRQTDKVAVKTPSPPEPKLEQKPWFLVGLRSHLLPPGCECCISCAVGGWPRPHVTWFKDGESLEGNPAVYSIDTLGVCSLVIPIVSSQDSGLYKAVAENALGQAVSTATLIVTESSF